MTLPPQGDILARCRSGDQSAWAELVDRYAGLVYAIARSSGLEEPACDDVAQEVFVALYRSLATIRDTEVISSWVATTARRAAWKAARRNRRRRTVDESRASGGGHIDQAGAEANLDAVERRHVVLAHLERLESRCRELLRAVLWAESTSYEDIGRRLGMPTGSIGPTRRRCLEKIRESLEAAGWSL